MESEFKFTYKTVGLEVVEVLEVINVIDNYFEFLSLFKFVGNIEAFYPLWVKTVHNYLGHTKLRPHRTLLFVKYNHTISSCKRVQVW